MKRWQIRLRDYLIQLSVVVLGIFITFGISDLIKAKQERKEFKDSLAFLKVELQSNLKRVQEVREGMEHLVAGAEQLHQVKWDVRKLPSDTLRKYANLPLFCMQFSYNWYAMDMIKNRSSYVSFRDGQMLLDLLDCYGEMQTFKEWSDYNFNKTVGIVADMDVMPIYEAMDKGDMVAYWEYLMKYPKIKNYIMDYGNLNERLNTARRKESVIREVLEKLEKEL